MRDKQDNFETKCQHNATYKRKLGDREEISLVSS